MIIIVVMIIIIITIVNINHVDLERMFQGHQRFLKLEKMKISTTKASYFSPGKNEGGPAQNKVSKASLIVVITIIINSLIVAITIIINSHPEKKKSSSTLPPSLASHCKIYSEADRRLKSCQQLYDDIFNIRKSPT